VGEHERRLRKVQQLERKREMQVCKYAYMHAGILFELFVSGLIVIFEGLG
jgi:hypothetical protein